MIPSVWHTTAAPWFTAGYEHMMLADTGIHQENELQSRLFQEVMFRLVYEGDPTSPWFAILPVLFTAFIIQLQWLITKPSTCGGSTMITAVLLVQNLVSTQTKYVGYQNIANDVLTFTYVVAIVYVGAVTLMTFINVTKQYGKIEWLAKHQDIIFKYFQLLGYLLSLLYIPLLVFDSNPETGEQQTYNWLWPLVVSIAVFIFLIAIAGDLRRWRVKTKDNIKGPPPDFHHLLSCDIGTLNRDEVETWIRNSDALAAAVHPYLSSDDLNEIAQTLYDAEIDGKALLHIATDTKVLVQSVGLSVGKAINFSEGFASLSQHASNTSADESLSGQGRMEQSPSLPA